MNPLPVQPAWQLADRPEQQRWLVDGLWSEEAVGIIGGEPKCGKSFLALDLAVAVAAGIPCCRWRCESAFIRRRMLAVAFCRFGLGGRRIFNRPGGA